MGGWCMDEWVDGPGRWVNRWVGMRAASEPQLHTRWPPSILMPKFEETRPCVQALWQMRRPACSAASLKTRQQAEAC